MFDALEDDNTLLLWAALHRQDLEAVQNIINDGVDVNIPDRHGMTPLLIASYTDQTDLVRELLNADACVNAVNNTGQTALHMAAKNGNPEIVNMLLKYECRINSMSKFSGMTPLHEASQRGHHEIVQILLEHGANINAMDMISKTAEYYAANEEVRETFQKYKELNGDTKSDMNSNLHRSIVYPDDPPELKEILEKYKSEMQDGEKEKTNLKKDSEKVGQTKGKNYNGEKIGNNREKKQVDKTSQIENINKSVSSKKGANKMDYLEKAKEIQGKFKANSEQKLCSPDKKDIESTKNTNDKIKDTGRNIVDKPLQDSIKTKGILQKQRAVGSNNSSLEETSHKEIVKDSAKTKEIEEKTDKDKTMEDPVQAKEIFQIQKDPSLQMSNLEDKTEKEIVEKTDKNKTTVDPVKTNEILQIQGDVAENDSHIEGKSEKTIARDSVRPKEIIQKQNVGLNNSNLEYKSEKEIKENSVGAKEIPHKHTATRLSNAENKMDTVGYVRRKTLENLVKAKEIPQKRRTTSVHQKEREINEKIVKLKDSVRDVRRKTLEDSVKAREILQKYRSKSDNTSNLKGENRKEIAAKNSKPIDRERTDKMERTVNTNVNSVRTHSEDSHSLSSGSESGSQTSLSKMTLSKKPQKEKVILKDHTMDFSDKHKQRQRVNVFDRLTKK